MNTRTNTPQIFNLSLLIIALILFIATRLGMFDRFYEFGIYIRSQLFYPIHSIAIAKDEFLSFINQLQEISLENMKLREQILEQSEKFAEYAALKEQNAWLTGELALDLPEYPGRSILRVVYNNGFVSPGYLMVEIPSNAKVSVNDWVTRYNYIVGQVTDVLDNYARIRLITAPESKLEVRVGEGVQVGWLVGQGGLSVRIDGLDSTSGIEVGEQIKIYSLNSIEYPEFSFGIIKEVIGIPAESTQEVILDTPVDFTNLNYLMLLPYDF